MYYVTSDGKHGSEITNLRYSLYEVNSPVPEFNNTSLTIQSSGPWPAFFIEDEDYIFGGSLIENNKIHIIKRIKEEFCVSTPSMPEQYDLCLMSEMIGDRPEPGKIYLIMNDGQIKYRTIFTDTDKLVAFDPGKNMALFQAMNSAINSESLAEISDEIKADFVEQLTKKGHISSAWAYNDAIDPLVSLRFQVIANPLSSEFGHDDYDVLILRMVPSFNSKGIVALINAILNDIKASTNPAFHQAIRLSCY